MAKSSPDGRTTAAKRVKTLTAAYEQAVGADALTAARKSLVRRVVSLEIEAERIEQDQARGVPVDSDQLGRLSGSIGRLLDRLGLTVRPGIAAAAPKRPFVWDPMPSYRAWARAAAAEEPRMTLEQQETLAEWFRAVDMCVL